MNSKIVPLIEKLRFQFQFPTAHTRTTCEKSFSPSEMYSVWEFGSWRRLWGCSGSTWESWPCAWLEDELRWWSREVALSRRVQSIPRAVGCPHLTAFGTDDDWLLLIAFLLDVLLWPPWKQIVRRRRSTTRSGAQTRCSCTCAFVRGSF